MTISAYTLKQLTGYARALGIDETALKQLAGVDYLEHMSARDADAVEAKLDQIDQQQKDAQQSPAPAAQEHTGRSEATRAHHRGGDHPLGELVERDGGRSVYRDGANGARVEIWDNE